MKELQGTRRKLHQHSQSNFVKICNYITTRRKKIKAVVMRTWTEFFKTLNVVMLT